VNARLVLIGPEPRPGEIKLKLPCIVGRSKQAGLTLIHSSISRQHCELSEYEGQLVANDLGSLNGTFINETRITEPTILPAGGTLRLGSVTLQAIYGDDADLAPPPVTPVAPAAASDPVAPPEPPANDSDDDFEMTDFLPDDVENAAAPVAEQEAAEQEDELMFDLDEPADTTVPLPEPEPLPPAPKPVAKPAAKPAPPKPAAGPVLPNPVPAAKPAPAKPAATEDTVSFTPAESAQEGDEDMDAFFRSLQ